ncbi:hypothetical protein RJT34_23407 [Clitoria ternatea]|uniref:Uncharacterized protein n=1 Tax=Clitoria ternatea TaxID=43366 RepID=A0AAN9IH60_CLITE
MFCIIVFAFCFNIEYLPWLVCLLRLTPQIKGKWPKRKSEKKDLGCISDLNYIDKSHVCSIISLLSCCKLQSNARTPNVAL